MGDIARCSIGKPTDYYNEELLYKLFGINAELLIDHAWGYEPCTMEDVKAYQPETNSISSGQVLHCPYEFDKARLVVKEMTDLMVLDLVNKGLVTNQIVLTIGYDIENITDKNGSIRAQSADIDIVALSDIDKKAVIGECKFKNEKIDKGIYETLVRRGTLISNKYKISKYIFFSLSGYTDWFNSLSDEDVLLLTLDSLYR